MRTDRQIDGAFARRSARTARSANTLRGGGQYAGSIRLAARDNLIVSDGAVLDASGEDRLPVVADDEATRVIGVAHRDTALKAHSEALQAAWREIHGGGG